MPKHWLAALVRSFSILLFILASAIIYTKFYRIANPKGKVSANPVCETGWVCRLRREILFSSGSSRLAIGRREDHD